jgi:hypothetical protein
MRAPDHALRCFPTVRRRQMKDRLDSLPLQTRPCLARCCVLLRHRALIGKVLKGLGRLKYNIGRVSREILTHVDEYPYPGPTTYLATLLR